MITKGPAPHPSVERKIDDIMRTWAGTGAGSSSDRQGRLYRTGKGERSSIAQLARSILLLLYANRFILRLYH